MATPTNEEIATAVGKTAGMFPVWVNQTPLDGTGGGFTAPIPPGAVADGVSIENSIKALYRVQLRKNSSYQSAAITITSVVDADTYRVTINAVNHDFVAPALSTEAIIIAGLVAAINGGAEPVLAIDNSAFSTPTLTLRSDHLDANGNGASSANYTLAVSVIGTGTMAAVHEATTATYELWFMPKNLAAFADAGPQAGETFDLYVFADGTTTRVITDNQVERIDSASLKAAFVRVTVTDGEVTPQWGPSSETIVA